MCTKSARFPVPDSKLGMSGIFVRVAWLVVIAVLMMSRPGMALAASDVSDTPVRLPGHVLPALADAAPVSVPKGMPVSGEPAQALTLTLVLNRDDEAGFQQYLHDAYDPASPIFRQFLTPQQIADRFGPSQQDYAAVLGWLQAQGFTLDEGSANRLTLTVDGSRAQAEQAFGVHINDYQSATRTFYANDENPSVPAELASNVLAVNGLSNLAQPRPQIEALVCGKNNGNAALNKKQLPCRILVRRGLAIFNFLMCSAFTGVAQAQPNPYIYGAGVLMTIVCGVASLSKDLIAGTGTSSARPPWAPQGLPSPQTTDTVIDGTGQTVGLLEFDAFNVADIQDYLTLTEAAPGNINNLSTVAVNGGVPSPGSGEAEVLIDIDAVMTLAPGAKVAVYEAPFGGRATSYTTLFNAMINNGVTVISNSWASCENQVSLADVQSIDSVLQTAAAAGISVFNASGDSGSTCLDGAANTIGVPADSPHATAVGGTSVATGSGPGFTYAGETWWDGSNATPPTGQSGFGLSKFFARPSYQNGLNPATMRSIPDVVTYADPEDGIVICQADDGGCPTGKLNGGTSLAAPEWAAIAATLNQAQGHNMGSLNQSMYPFAATAAFHNAASMGSDFAHVGLGSPNINVLNRLLANGTVGPAMGNMSPVSPYVDLAAATVLPDDTVTVAADGTTQGNVRVTLRDVNGYFISGKSVTLTSDSSTAVITPASGLTSVNDGAVVFNVTDLVPEKVTFAATDTSDGVALHHASLTFGVPSAASAGIGAFPTMVNADGTSTTTITVTLQDARSRPSPGKLVTVSQGSGHSVITGPSPSVTGSNGEIQFTATDLNNEAVTYTAVDVSDGDLPVPGSAAVTFSNAVGSCVPNPPPSAASGFALTSFATGFFTENFFYGNVNFGCSGASNPTFTPGGNVYLADFPSGNLYRFGDSGGAATSPLSNLAPTVSAPTLAPDGRLYVTHAATTGNFTTGDIEEIDPSTGAKLRTVASNLTCPGGLSIDPLSGDLFFDDQCTGGGSDNPSIFRVVNPAGTSPSVVVYATLPATPNGAIAFSPDGTLYVVNHYYLNPTAPVLAVSGTNKPQPPTITTVPNLTTNYWVNVGAVQANGAAKSLIVLSGTSGNMLESVDITTNPYTVTQLATGIGSGTIGPDGCLYAAYYDTVYKLAPATGPCEFAATNPSPALALSPLSVSPNPIQGGTQVFTATFHNVTVPAGTPVYFAVSGANAQTKLVNTNASGMASFTEAGVIAGSDSIVASATVGTSTLTSIPALVTWNAGPHTSFLSLNRTPGGGPAGAASTLTAALFDVSVNPNVPIAGATLQFTVDNQSCGGTTNAAGVASCGVTVRDIGAFTLTVRYAGTANYLPAVQSLLFSTNDRIFANGFDPPL